MTVVVHKVDRVEVPGLARQASIQRKGEELIVAVGSGNLQSVPMIGKTFRLDNDTWQITRWEGGSHNLTTFECTRLNNAR